MPYETSAFSLHSAAALRRNTIKMSDREFRTVIEFVYKHTGIEFKPNKRYLLESRLSPRVAALGCNSYQDYIFYLKYDQSRREFHKLVSAVTINETSFMRNLPQLEVFQQQILPSLTESMRKRPLKKIRLWSAGCSSGEEPYSLAILLHELFPRLFQNRLIEIIATDIDEEVLRRARKGQYKNFTLRKLTSRQLTKYFTKSGSTHEIIPKIKDVVKFSYLNLNDVGKIKLLKNIDVIFFRNVMIYFGCEPRKKIIASMYDSLQHGGYLFLGHSESLHGLTKAFRMLNIGKTMIYMKE